MRPYPVQCANPCILKRGHLEPHRDSNGVTFTWERLGPSLRFVPVPIVELDDVADADLEVWEEEHAAWVEQGSPCADVGDG